MAGSHTIPWPVHRWYNSEFILGPHAGFERTPLRVYSSLAIVYKVPFAGVRRTTQYDEQVIKSLFTNSSLI